MTAHPEETTNATGGGVAAPASTSGVRSTPTSQEEIVMADSNPRRESPLDPADPVVAAVAERSGVDYGTAAEMLGDFMASLKRDQGVSE